MNLLFRYTLRLFLLRFTVVFLGLGILCGTLELLMVRKNLHEICFAQQLQGAFLKTPFILGKLFPLSIFFTGILVCWRLLSQNEWSVFQSSGASFAKMVLAPLIASALLSGGDLLFWTPWSFSLLEKAFVLQQKTANRSQFKPSEIWRRFSKEKKITLVRAVEGEQAEWVVFSKEHLFAQHLHARKVFWEDSNLRLQDIWVVQDKKPPYFEKEISLPIPDALKKRPLLKHPLLMSFWDIQKHISKHPGPQKVFLLRQTYLVAHFIWVISLLPFSAACMVGYTRGYRKFWSVFWGILGCFVLFILKEWMFYGNMPLPFAWVQGLCWMPVLLTLLITFLILLEKGEL